jgi:hypothetical protein
LREETVESMQRQVYHAELTLVTLVVGFPFEQAHSQDRQDFPFYSQAALVVAWVWVERNK